MYLFYQYCYNFLTMRCLAVNKGLLINSPKRDAWRTTDGQYDVQNSKSDMGRNQEVDQEDDGMMISDIGNNQTGLEKRKIDNSVGLLSKM